MSARRGEDPAGAVLRPLIPSVYLPTVLEAAGESALLPVVPLLALHLGFSVPGAAALTMIAGAAAVLGPIPVGRLMDAVGARRAIVTSGIALVLANLTAMAVIGGGLAGDPAGGHRAALVALLMVVAATSQVWSLGRQSYLGTALPPGLRARGMTTFGGMLRIGQVIGPLLGAVVTALGHEAWVFGLFALMTAAATALVARFLVPGEARAAPPPGARSRDAREVADDVAETAAEPGATTGGTDPGAALGEEDAPGSGRAVLRRMIRVGAGIMPVMMGRINRPVIVPLLGAGLGLDASTISIVFGFAAVLEIVMFVPAGRIMDSRGRAAVAVPCSAVMGVGYLLMAVLAVTLPGASPGASLLALAVPSCLIALGNGLGSGIVMTLGVDVSPERGRTRYLAWWNTIIGTGRLTAPLLVSVVTLVAPVAVAGALSGALCLAGAGWLARVLPGVVPSGSGPSRGSARG